MLSWVLLNINCKFVYSLKWCRCVSNLKAPIKPLKLYLVLLEKTTLRSICTSSIINSSNHLIIIKICKNMHVLIFFLCLFLYVSHLNPTLNYQFDCLTFSFLKHNCLSVSTSHVVITSKSIPNKKSHYTNPRLAIWKPLKLGLISQLHGVTLGACSTLKVRYGWQFTILKRPLLWTLTSWTHTST